MLRLDKTISRKTTLHADQDAEERARWQAMSFTEKREIVAVLQQRRRELRALCKAGREQDRNKNTGHFANGELAD